MSDTPILLDQKGDPLVSEQSLPEVRVFDLAELTAAVSALLRVLVAIHGVEVMQLFAIHAEDIEKALAAATEEQ